MDGFDWSEWSNEEYPSTKMTAPHGIVALVSVVSPSRETAWRNRSWVVGSIGKAESDECMVICGGYTYGTSDAIEMCETAVRQLIPNGRFVHPTRSEEW